MLLTKHDMNKWAITGIVVGVLAVLTIVANIVSPDETPKPTVIDDTSDKMISQTTSKPMQTTKSSCDSSYPDVCIPPYPPDLDCGEISYKGFRVIGEDRHGFDADRDGIGCES